LEQILANLKQCETLLRNVGEKFWADVLLGIIVGSSEKSVNVTLDEILSMYGGAGSINDLVISKYNGHTVDSSTEEKINNNFNKLRVELYHQVVLEEKKIS
jgi:hypothetical protein